MNLLGKTILIFSFLTSPGFAENWICQTPDGLNRMNGDGVRLGICENNNKNITPGCIEATEQEYTDAGIAYKKIDKSIVTGSRIVDMTKAETDAIEQPKMDAEAAEKTKIDSLKLKLKALGFTDEEIALILNSGI